MLLGIASTWGVDGIFSQISSFTVSRGPQTFSDLEISANRCIVIAFLQTPCIRGLNGKSYQKTLRGLIIGLLETIQPGHFFSQNFRKYGR